jgi:hypothetical protein
VSRVLAFLAAAFAACVVTAGAAASSSAPKHYTDPAGDSGTAADITGIDVSNDDQGQYTFDVTFATAYGSTHFFEIDLDTDGSTSTGDPASLGADFSLVDDHANHSFDLYKWSGTEWDEAPTSATVSVTIAQDAMSLTVSVNRSEIGDPSAFDFFAYSSEGDGSTGRWDDAPSGSGTFHYALQPTVTLSYGAGESIAPRAGGLWTVSIVVKRSDTGDFLGPEATIVCAASYKGIKLNATLHTFVSVTVGTIKAAGGVCQWRVPKKLKHKKLAALVTVSFAGQSLKHTFTTVVK